MDPTGLNPWRATAVLVTGVPGAGKTTLATALAEALEIPFLSLDQIKEGLYERDGRRTSYELRRDAEAELVHQLAGEAGRVVLDIWIAPGRDTERVRALLRDHTTDVVEVLCRVPADVAVERYLRRPRARPHLPPDEATLLRIREAVEVIEPVGIGTCIEVDTSQPIDLQQILARLRA